MASPTLTITDNRTGKRYDLPIEHDAIRATDLAQIRVAPSEPGLVSYDPALLNTAACKSKVSYIDGERGILRYRGYPIEELAEKSSFLETAYLIVKGELPTTSHFKMWQRNITMHTLVHESVRHFIEGFRYDAHEQNCSTTTMRVIGSSLADPYSAVAGAAAALGGPRHGSANEEVVHMLHEIGSAERIPALIKQVKAGERRLMGFGHRVYKNYDPRARIIKQIAHQVFEVTGKNPLIDIALELERIALEDNYFVSRRLYPNVDFYSGIIYEAMGLPVAMFPVLFAIARTAGWMAQWAELVLDEEQKITRPKQLYLGYDERHYVPLDGRAEGGPREDAVPPGPL